MHRRTHLAAVAALAAAPALLHAQQGPSPAEALLERLLDAVGGRDRWAGLRCTLNDSQQNRVAEPVVVRARILMDFERPRFRIDTEGEGGLRLVRVIDGDRHWRRTRDGQIQPVSEATLQDDRRWYAAHLYRSLARLARRDAALGVRLGADARLDVFEQDRRLLWFRCDARGEPFAFGTHDSEAPTLLGPWAFEAEGIRHPVWTSNADGSFRAQLRELRINPPIDEALFAKPQV